MMNIRAGFSPVSTDFGSKEREIPKGETLARSHRREDIPEIRAVNEFANLILGGNNAQAKAVESLDRGSASSKIIRTSDDTDDKHGITSRLDRKA